MSDRNNSPEQEPAGPIGEIAAQEALATAVTDGASETPETPAASPVDPNDSALGDTVGTGSIIALGCITATVFLIVLGLVYLGITQLFG